MINVLFIEAGTKGGGSFESLYQYLKIIDRNKISPFIICFNETKYNMMWKELGVPVLLITDPVYSNLERNIINYSVRKLHSLISRSSIFPFEFILKSVHYKTNSLIKSYIKMNRIDVLYLNNQIQRDLPFVIASKGMGVKVISHQRSIRGKGFSKKMAICSNKNVDYFVANSVSSYNHWANKGISKNKMSIIYNFVVDNGDLVKPILRETKATVLGTLANFTSVKGHYFLLDSFKRLVSNGSNYILLLGGQGEDENSIKKYVVDNGLSEKVKFLGYTERDTFFSKIDILIVPSSNETFGRVVLEGMMAKVPVIGTNVGGIPEIIEDRANGLLVEYGNTEQLEEAIRTLDSDYILKEKINKNALDTVKKYSPKKYLASIDRILFEIL